MNKPYTGKLFYCSADGTLYGAYSVAKMLRGKLSKPVMDANAEMLCKRVNEYDALIAERDALKARAEKAEAECGELYRTVCVELEAKEKYKAAWQEMSWHLEPLHTSAPSKYLGRNVAEVAMLMLREAEAENDALRRLLSAASRYIPANAFLGDARTTSLKDGNLLRQIDAVLNGTAKQEPKLGPYGCRCQTLSHRITGDGCDICNPELAAELSDKPKPRTCGECAKSYAAECPHFGSHRSSFMEAPKNCFRPRADAQKGANT